MKREEFVGSVTDMLKIYIDNSGSFDSNPQLRVNPLTIDATIVNGKDMLAEMERSIETVEQAAGAQGAADEADTDYQVTRNPDFYAVLGLIEERDGRQVPDIKAIEKVADTYFSK